MICWDWTKVWQKSRENWHWPQLSMPRLSKTKISGEFPFQNYSVTLDPATLDRGPRGQIGALEMLNGNAHVVLLACVANLEPGQYEKVLAILGQKGDPKRWYRDQSYSIEIRELPKSRLDN